MQADHHLSELSFHEDASSAPELTLNEFAFGKIAVDAIDTHSESLALDPDLAHLGVDGIMAASKSIADRYIRSEVPTAAMRPEDAPSRGRYVGTWDVALKALQLMAVTGRRNQAIEAYYYSEDPDRRESLAKLFAANRTEARAGVKLLRAQHGRRVTPRESVAQPEVVPTFQPQAEDDSLSSERRIVPVAQRMVHEGSLAEVAITSAHALNVYWGALVSDRRYPEDLLRQAKQNILRVLEASQTQRTGNPAQRPKEVSLSSGEKDAIVAALELMAAHGDYQDEALEILDANQQSGGRKLPTDRYEAIRQEYLADRTFTQQAARRAAEIIGGERSMQAVTALQSREASIDASDRQFRPRKSQAVRVPLQPITSPVKGGRHAARRRQPRHAAKRK